MESEKLQLFEDQRIRTAWDEENEEWYFSIVDVVGALTESSDFDTSRKYWNNAKLLMTAKIFPRCLMFVIRSSDHYLQSLLRFPVLHSSAIPKA